jgi:hypothetical protein
MFKGRKRFEDVGKDCLENCTKTKSCNIHDANCHSSIGEPIILECITLYHTWKEQTEPPNKVEPSNEVDGVSIIKVGVWQHPHYLIRFFNGVGIETIEMVAVSPKGTMSLPMGHVGLIHPLLTESLQNVFGSETPLHGIKIYKDAKISVNGGIQQIRAFANYDKDGS